MYAFYPEFSVENSPYFSLHGASCPYSLPKISLLSVPAWTPETPYVPEFAEQTRVKNRTQDVRFLNLPLDAFFEVLPHTGIKTFALEQLGMRSRFGNPALIDDADC